MRFHLTILALLAAVPAAAAANPPATATLRDPQGKVVGTATLEPVEGGFGMSVAVSGVAPGLHGFHVHAVGTCEGPDFKTAGGHFNPGSKEHGLDNPKGSHAGDLPNLEEGADGT